MDILSTIASNRYYKIEYEHGKLIKLFLIAILIFLIGDYFNNFSIVLRIFFKIILIASFPLIIIISGYFSKKELEAISGAIKKWRNPKNWKVNLILEESLKKKSDDS